LQRARSAFRLVSFIALVHDNENTAGRFIPCRREGKPLPYEFTSSLFTFHFSLFTRNAPPPLRIHFFTFHSSLFTRKSDPRPTVVGAIRKRRGESSLKLSFILPSLYTKITHHLLRIAGEFLLIYTKGVSKKINSAQPLWKSSFAEIFLACAAEGACKVFGKVFEFGAGSNAVIGIALCLVVFPATQITYIFFHFCKPHFIFLLFFYLISSKSEAPCLQSGQMKSSGSSSPS